MWQVILGRVVSGFGSAAMTVATALTITSKSFSDVEGDELKILTWIFSAIDLFPLREVAAWQAGLNLISTTGRTLGAPLGGILADTIGWRWSFLGQAPIFLFGMLLCAIYLPRNMSLSAQTPTVEALSISAATPELRRAILARIDYTGALLLALCLLTFLLPIETWDSTNAWSNPSPFILLGSSVVFGYLFYINETRWAKEPIFPLALLQQRDIQATYMTIGLQTAAQLGLMFSVPLYFQVTERATNTVAGAHLTPAVVGNAIGGILAGVLIKR